MPGWVILANVPVRQPAPGSARLFQLETLIAPLEGLAFLLLKALVLLEPALLFELLPPDLLERGSTSLMIGSELASPLADLHSQPLGGSGRRLSDLRAS